MRFCWRVPHAPVGELNARPLVDRGLVKPKRRCDLADRRRACPALGDQSSHRDVRKACRVADAAVRTPTFSAAVPHGSGSSLMSIPTVQLDGGVRNEGVGHVVHKLHGWDSARRRGCVHNRRVRFGQTCPTACVWFVVHVPLSTCQHLHRYTKGGWTCDSSPLRRCGSTWSSGATRFAPSPPKSALRTEPSDGSPPANAPQPRCRPPRRSPRRLIAR